MFCTQCGAQNLEDSQFCHSCGSDLSRSRPPSQSGTKPGSKSGSSARSRPATPPPPTNVQDVGDLETHYESSSPDEQTLIEGRLQLQDKLGEGGMGVVWKARDIRLGRIVAFKRPKPDMLTPEGRARFLREAQASARLSHPNIITIYTVGEDEEGPFIEMEYVAGSSLRDEVRRNGGGLPEKWVRDLGVQLCGALGMAHSIGIIHRDIKPANILLTREGTAKLGDFGLAAPGADMASMTASGAVMGTMFYASPEQLRGAHGLDGRSDIYSLAATLYFALTGEDPRVIRFEKVPVSLRPVLQKALEENPENRWPDMAAFEKAMTQPPAPPPIPPRPPDQEAARNQLRQVTQDLMRRGEYGQVISRIQSSAFAKEAEFEALARQAKELDSPLAHLNRQIQPLLSSRSFRQLKELLEKVKHMNVTLPNLNELHQQAGQALEQAQELLAQAKQAAATGDWQKAYDLARQGEKVCADEPEFAALARQAQGELGKIKRKKRRPKVIAAVIIFAILAGIGIYQNNHPTPRPVPPIPFTPTPTPDVGLTTPTPPPLGPHLGSPTPAPTEDKWTEWVKTVPIPSPTPKPTPTPINQAELTGRLFNLFVNFGAAARTRIQMLPSNAQYAIGQGIACSTANNFSGALSWFNQAVTLTGGQDPVSTFMAGYVCLLMGDTTSFHLAMTNAKRLDTDGSLSRYVDELLSMEQDILNLQKNSTYTNPNFGNLFQ